MKIISLLEDWGKGPDTHILTGTQPCPFICIWPWLLYSKVPEGNSVRDRAAHKQSLSPASRKGLLLSNREARVAFIHIDLT